MSEFMGIILEVQNLYVPLGAIQSLDAITGERSLSGAKCLLCCEAEFKVMTWRLISSDGFWLLRGVWSAFYVEGSLSLTTQNVTWCLRGEWLFFLASWSHLLVSEPSRMTDNDNNNNNRWTQSRESGYLDWRMAECVILFSSLFSRRSFSSFYFHPCLMSWQDKWIWPRSRNCLHQIAYLVSPFTIVSSLYGTPRKCLTRELFHLIHLWHKQMNSWLWFHNQIHLN